MAKKHDYKDLLVPVGHPDDINRVVELSSILVDQGSIDFLTVVKKGSFVKMQKNWRTSSNILNKHKRRITDRKVKATSHIRYDDSITEGVLNQAKENDSDLLVLGWGRTITFRFLQQTPMERIFEKSDKDVLAFKNRSGKLQNIEKILFPIGYKDYDYSKRLSLVSKIIKNTGAECKLVHVLKGDETEEEAEEILHNPKQYMKELDIDCETKILKNPDISKALIQESKNYDMIVLGPTREYVFSRYMFGGMTDIIVNNVDCSALVFKEGEKKWKALIKGALKKSKDKLKNLFQ